MGSGIEINDQKGMRHGGMPYDTILYKLEETDSELIDEVRGEDDFHDIQDDFTNYVRTEITDWAPDGTFLESDTVRRDPALSRSMLNLRYNGTRGSYPELPRHPELFYGFTGNDPRGGVDRAVGSDRRRSDLPGGVRHRALAALPPGRT